MNWVSVRPSLLLLVCCLLFASSCGQGQKFYPVHGKVTVDGNPGQGVLVVFHPQTESDPPLLPQAVVGADGSFSVQTWLVEQRELKEGAPAGQYDVTCVWYPEDLGKHGGGENLPDRLHGKYSNKQKAGLRADVRETTNELPAYELTSGK